uniref:Proline rich mitotic checkpoint control factor n=1 Tax=Eptatretus burgeri TaxID=7764 RepID=A0A8C4NNK1_EPTBU
MSLVDYGSSDESDADEEVMKASPYPGLPSSRPSSVSARLDRRPQEPSGVTSLGPSSALPPPKKRSEPVKIPLPALPASDSDEDEPTPKKGYRVEGGRPGLSALLPKPKKMAVKEAKRALVPHVLSQNKATRLTSESAAQLTVPSPSAIKTASKFATQQVASHARHDAEVDDMEKDELPMGESFFSIPETPPPPPSCAIGLPDPRGLSVLPEGESKEIGPLAGPPVCVFSEEFAYPENYPEPYAESCYQAVDESAQQDPTRSSILENEAFKRLQGRRNRGEEVNFIEVKGDEQLSGLQNYLTKSLTEEKEMKSFSKKRGEQPTSQQRRKHQLSYLIHQAKERELELKNSWSENRLTRRQTQAKYGF